MAIDLTYPKDWVVIQNRVVECFKSMTLDEKRLFILATLSLVQQKYRAMILFSFLLVSFLASAILIYQLHIQHSKKHQNACLQDSLDTQHQMVTK